MRPATAPRDDRDDTRLLAVDRDSGAVRDGAIRDLAGLLRRGDLLVVNDAATLPASLHARALDRDDSEPTLELRLTGAIADDRARVILFGAGDWRSPTERRPAPPPLSPGDVLVLLAPDGSVPQDMSPVTATVAVVDPRAPRLLTLRLDRSGAALWAALYRLGRPVQHRREHVAERPLGFALVLGDVQPGRGGFGGGLVPAGQSPSPAG